METMGESSGVYFVLLEHDVAMVFTVVCTIMIVSGVRLRTSWAHHCRSLVDVWTGRLVMITRLNRRMFMIT